MVLTSHCSFCYIFSASSRQGYGQKHQWLFSKVSIVVSLCALGGSAKWPLFFHRPLRETEVFGCFSTLSRNTAQGKSKGHDEYRRTDTRL
jgi:hypothetical protein